MRIRRLDEQVALLKAVDEALRDFLTIGGPLASSAACEGDNYYDLPHTQEEERECDRTIGSFGHQSEITREQLSLPLASPPSPSGIRGILWVVQSIDLWLVSRGHLMTPMKYSDRHLAGLSARPPDRVELIGAGSLGYGNGPASAEG